VIGAAGPEKMNSSSEEAGRSSFVEEDKAGALRAAATGAEGELELLASALESVGAGVAVLLGG
jgi:hypothetical protein